MSATATARTPPILLAASVLLILSLTGGPAGAQAGKGGSASLLPGASARDPVSIEASKLDYFDKEQRLVYTGDVRAKQGESTLKGSVLTIFLTKDPAKSGDAAKSEDTSPLDTKQAGTSVRRMEVAGPVTVVSKEEVGTGDSGVYDKAENRITLSGNVTLSQGTNVIKGDTLVYDMTSGRAQVSSGRTQLRVTSVFTPGSGGPGGLGASPRKPKGSVPAAKGTTPSQASQ